MYPYNSNMILHAFLYTTIMFTEVTSHKLRKNESYIHCIYHEFLMPYVKLMSIVNKHIPIFKYRNTLYKQLFIGVLKTFTELSAGDICFEKYF
jgi:hypothetical protein